MKHLIKVTNEHIRKGKPFNTQSCPVALAVRECIPNGSSTDISVFDTIFLSTNENRWKCRTPDDVFEKILRYDSFNEMSPFEFEIELEPD